jgi:hypothetical protein
LSSPTPEEAAAEARRRAEAARAAGEYADAERLAALEPRERAEVSSLHAWAFIEVDPEVARSTRRLGAPITAFKRLLVRLLRQYHHELAGQQTRFNLHLLAHVRRLEERVAALEERLPEDERR